MPGQLTKENKDKILSAIARMEADGVPEAEIRATVDEFKSKHSLPDRPASPDDYTEQPQPAGGRFLEGAWRNLNPIPMVKGLIDSSQAAQENVKNAKSMREQAAAAIQANPIVQLGGMVAGMLRENAAQLPKAYNDLKQGRYSEAAGHTAAGLLPAIGPAAAHAGERIGAGDVAGGLGEATGLLLPSAVSAAPKGTGRAVASTGAKLYEKALKPLRSVAERNPGKNLAQIGLENNIPLTRSGAAGLNNTIRGIENDVTQAVNGSSAKVSLNDAVQHARTRLTGEGGAFRDLGSDRAAVEATLKDLTQSHPDFSAPSALSPADILEQVRSGKPLSEIGAPEIRDLSVSEGHALKQRLHGRVRDANWGEMASPQQEALKSVAHDLREQTLNAVPETRPMLEKQSDLLAFQDTLDKALPRLANRNPLPLEAAVHLAGGVTPVRAAAALTSLPRSMDILGRLMYRGGKALTNHSVASGEMTAALMRAALLDQMRGGNEQ